MGMSKQGEYKYLGDLFEKLRSEDDISIGRLAKAIHIGTTKYELLKKGALYTSVSL